MTRWEDLPIQPRIIVSMARYFPSIPIPRNLFLQTQPQQTNHIPYSRTRPLPTPRNQKVQDSFAFFASWAGCFVLTWVAWDGPAGRPPSGACTRGMRKKKARAAASGSRHGRSAYGIWISLNCVARRSMGGVSRSGLSFSAWLVACLLCFVGEGARRRERNVRGSDGERWEMRGRPLPGEGSVRAATGQCASVDIHTPTGCRGEETFVLLWT